MRKLVAYLVLVAFLLVLASLSILADLSADALASLATAGAGGLVGYVAGNVGEHFSSPRRPAIPAGGTLPPPLEPSTALQSDPGDRP